MVLNTVVAVSVRSCLVRQSRYIALTAPQRPRLAQLAFLVVAAFLLTNKVWSPQFSLWLVPLAVLALPHRRILLAWMTIDALVWVPRMYYLYGNPNRSLPEQWFTTTVLLRDIAVVALCALVIRQIYRPGEDLVRWGGRVDDPGGRAVRPCPRRSARLAAATGCVRPGRVAGARRNPDVGRDGSGKPEPATGTSEHMMQVAIPLFPRFTALDAVGPYEVLQRIPSVDVVFVGHRRGEVRTENGMLGVSCDATFDEVGAPDVVVVPGGIGTRRLIHDEAIRAWLQSVHPHTTFTTSVCTGALLLAAAGPARRAHRHDALEGRGPAQRVGCALRARRASSSTYRSGSSPPRACPAASTWPCGWSSCWSTERPRRPLSCSSNTTRSRRSTRASLAKADDATRARADEFRQARN